MALIGSRPVPVFIWWDRHQDRSTEEPSSQPWSAAHSTGRCYRWSRPPVLSRRSRIGRRVFEEVVWQVAAGFAERIANRPGEVVGHVRASAGEDGPVFDALTTVCEAAEQPECHLACGIVETERGPPGEVVESLPQELFKDFAGGLVLMHISATLDSPGR